jgi:hypothetical protein
LEKYEAITMSEKEIDPMTQFVDNWNKSKNKHPITGKTIAKTHTRIRKECENKYTDYCFILHARRSIEEHTRINEIITLMDKKSEIYKEESRKIREAKRLERERKLPYYTETTSGIYFCKKCNNECCIEIEDHCSHFWSCDCVVLCKVCKVCNWTVEN